SSQVTVLTNRTQRLTHWCLTKRCGLKRTIQLNSWRR
ncbi:DNA polymerase III, alpha subunit, partial [Vibrio parahaemolyticus V-223/04]